jgi:hypothetical protein
VGHLLLTIVRRVRQLSLSKRRSHHQLPRTADTYATRMQSRFALLTAGNEPLTALVVQMKPISRSAFAKMSELNCLYDQWYVDEPLQRGTRWQSAINFKPQMAWYENAFVRKLPSVGSAALWKSSLPRAKHRASRRLKEIAM